MVVFAIPSLALLLHLPISLSLPTYTCNWKTTGQLVSRSGVNPTVIHSTFAPMAHTDNILIICIMCASVSMLAQVSVHVQIETGKKCRLHVRDARSSCKLCVAVRWVMEWSVVLLMLSNGNRSFGIYFSLCFLAGNLSPDFGLRSPHDFPW